MSSNQRENMRERAKRLCVSACVYARVCVCVYKCNLKHTEKYPSNGSIQMCCTLNYYTQIFVFSYRKQYKLLTFCYFFYCWFFDGGGELFFSEFISFSLSLSRSNFNTFAQPSCGAYFVGYSAAFFKVLLLLCLSCVGFQFGATLLCARYVSFLS